MADHRSSHDIERGLEQDRAGLADTLDGLREKFSMNAIIRQTADQLGEHGGDVGASVSRAVKDNPMALALTGVGLAWLIFGGKSGAAHPSERGNGRDTSAQQSWDRPRNQPMSDEQTGGYARGTSASDPLDSRRTGNGRAAVEDKDVPTWLRNDDEGHKGAHAGGTNISGRARATLDNAGEHASNAAEALRSGVRETANEAQDRVGAIRDRLAEGTEQLSAEGRERVIDARERVHHARDAAMAQARKGQDRVSDMFDDQPLIAGALALAVGAAIGAALPRTEFEDENFGAQSDELIREAEQILSQERAKVGAVVGAAMDEARDIADETGATVEDAVEQAKSDADRNVAHDPTTKDLVDTAKDSVQEAGQRIADSAKTEADKQNLGNIRS